MPKFKKPKPKVEKAPLPEGTDVPTQVEVVGLVRKLTTDKVEEKIDPAIITPIERDAIIEYLRYNENLSDSAIATVLGITANTVRNRVEVIDKIYRARIMARGIDPYTAIADLKRVKTVVQQKAAKKGDWNLVWRSELDIVQKYMDLGLLKQFNAIDESEFEVIDAEFVDRVNEELAPKEVSAPKKPKEKDETKTSKSITAKAIRQKLEEMRSKHTPNKESDKGGSLSKSDKTQKASV